MPWCIISHFLQSHLVGGQVIDRPPPPRRSTVTNINAIASSNNHHHPSAQDRQLQIVGTNNSSSANNNGQLEHSTIDVLGDLVPSSVAYALELVKHILWFPISKVFPSLRGGNNKSSADQTKSKKPSWIIQTLQSVGHQAYQLWLSQGVSLQALLTTVLLVLFIDTLYRFLTSETQFSLLAKLFGRPMLSKLLDREPDMTILTVNTGAHSNLLRRPENKSLLGNSYRGDYNRRRQPEWLEVFWLLWVLATVSSSLVFCRILPPLQDWIAGENISKDLKQEARHTYSLLHPKKRAWWRDLILFEVPSHGSPTSPWCERNQCIAATNRVQLAIYVVLARLFENTILFGILPRTHFICRLTGHCSTGPAAFELPCLLYPTGYIQSTRSDCRASALMESDAVSAVVVLVGVVIISVLLLSAQTLVLQRSYLSTLSHVTTTDWKRIRPPPSILHVWKAVVLWESSKSRTAAATTPPAVWEAGRRYRERDVVAYPTVHGALYEATCTGPEGRPPDDHLLPAYAILCQEMGPLSEVLQSMATFQVGRVVYGHTVLTMLSLVVRGVGRSTWLLYVMAAHTLTGYGLLYLWNNHAPLGDKRKDLYRLHAELYGDHASKSK